MTIATAGIIILVFYLYSNQSTNPKEIADYKIYYGAPSPRIIKEMQSLDMVILEAHHYTASQIESIKSNGTLVLSYLNVLEIDNWNASVRDKIKDTDYFYRNGEKVYYPKWDSYLADITSPHYQSLLKEEMKTDIHIGSVDGVFLDTVGDIDNEHSTDPVILKEQQKGVTDLIMYIKETYPGLLVAQNWGFDTLKNYTAPYIDFIMWESFQSDMVASNQWASQQIKILQDLRKNYDFQVLTVSFKNKVQSENLAAENGFIHLHTNKDYLKW
ncbi:endo alpha-1,4 polygalactosaminidase [Bacillus salacetis]|uniref:endo alpha-1,4 polygalactosaminidase n=1 Tax=Bacillus salacetis TaxID=2315464 RepID=UPI003BA1FF79